MNVRLVFASACLIASFHASGQQDCAGLRPQEVVRCYIGNVRQAPLDAQLFEQTSSPDYRFLAFHMTSQQWAPAPVTEPREWKHDVELYVPRHAVPGKALLVVNNGVRFGAAQPPSYTREVLREVALKARIAVVMVSDVPNQALTFSDVQKPLREDEAVAHTWAHSLNDQAAAPELPLQVPMAAAASRAMDLAQEQLKKIGHKVDRFIITGGSKRGWGAWLTALADDRVMAIVPNVIEVEDTAAMLAGLRKRYGGHWPLALLPYQQAGVLKQLDSPGFARLAAMIDPMQYLNEHGQRLAIPKYLISASGDDFFAPDPVTDYQQRLPGQTSLRVLPNSDHAGVREAVVSTLVPVVRRLHEGEPLPRVQLIADERAGTMQVRFSERPLTVKVWTASNSRDRDFRYACGVRYVSQTIKPKRRLTVQRTAPSVGWQAQFIEATFADGFIATSPVSVWPQTFPDHPPADLGGACRSVPADIP
ncbi:PhoPQ-activated protein PqaA family protein [Pseudomonas sp. MN1F]|uniref:PhoPQ-activated protein PqaA family protein n=1 Tax=Pseudomonas sp. MN1F TaxID=1366632 RepID=UPI00128F673C|nr:PhoPQ-activated protein PqaA family protein [Pseudomonas sp. MN1F]MQG92459.1 PhoPQ-activated pathogenicity protein [Pseudomonas sp. MN1F]